MNTCFAAQSKCVNTCVGGKKTSVHIPLDMCSKKKKARYTPKRPLALPTKPCDLCKIIFHERWRRRAHRHQNGNRRRWTALTVESCGSCGALLGLQSAPKRWQERLKKILMGARLQTSLIDHVVLCTHKCVVSPHVFTMLSQAEQHGNHIATSRAYLLGTTHNDWQLS